MPLNIYTVHKSVTLEMIFMNGSSQADGSFHAQGVDCDIQKEKKRLVKYIEEFREDIDRMPMSFHMSSNLDSTMFGSRVQPPFPISNLTKHHRANMKNI